MSKEVALFNALRNSLAELNSSQRTALLVHATCIANGFVPEPILPGENGFICVLPSENWLENTRGENEIVFTFKYIGGKIVKCVPLTSGKMAVHATHNDDPQLISSLQVNTSSDNFNQVVTLLKANILPSDRTTTSHVYVATDSPASSHQPARPSTFPRSRPIPMGPGELVGPNHPIFTGETDDHPSGIGDPRFDPIGPGFIGEPDSDHFPPPPFGQPPSGTRPALRGPHANIGPGGMFM